MLVAAALIALWSCRDVFGAGQGATAPVLPQAAEPTPLPVDSDIVTELVSRARADLASRLGVTEDLIQLASVDEVEWPDACLGIPAPGRMCAQVIVPGYRIVLEQAGQAYEYRANLSGSQLKFAG